jgi:hypothetical protein
LGGLKLENVDIFYGHLEYFTDIWYIFCSFGTFLFIWNIFTGFGIMYQEKSGNPARQTFFNGTKIYVMAVFAIRHKTQIENFVRSNVNTQIADRQNVDKKMKKSTSSDPARHPSQVLAAPCRVRLYPT